MKRLLIFCVTGTPGCGKTAFARKLARDRGLAYVSLTELLCKENVYEHYDRSLQSYVVDEGKVRALLVALAKKAKKEGQGVVIDGHLSHYLPPRYADRCYVLKCSIAKLKRRLQKRKYSETKIRENLDAEILDVCLVEALEMGHHVNVVET